ncbi:uncharacterized protein [Centruroides vittatus]|uniref:uncharacterized protein n=1 Tax=Centruroides vittatus TaxID=120091 RepID=UPI00350F4630
MSNGFEQVSTRAAMQEYWKNFSPSNESMMLDPNAEILGPEEQLEILSYLPDLKGMEVLELGAGIGRFTGDLAKRSKNVTAVDFIDDYIKENKKKHSSLQNIKFMRADVTELEFSAKKFDMVFSNWLFMYLNDKECVSLVQKVIKWLKPDGYLFIRESCYKSSGGIKRSTNPTFYRSPATYNALLQSIRLIPQIYSPLQESQSWELRVLNVRSLRTYIKYKKNPWQVCFLSVKMSGEQLSSATSHDNFQHFLDQQQYSRRGVRRYEWIYGETYLSTGGLETTKEFVQLLKLKPGNKVLDVGSGLGGHDFYMAKTFGVTIHGVDLSVNMMSLALEHLAKRPELESKIHFEICDITQAEFEPNTFDAIYSRDTLLHIENKYELFQKFLKWLKPGGRILFSDYSRGNKEHTEEFKEYIKQRGYHLLTLEEYEKLLNDVGFINVNCKDGTEEFLQALKNELKKLHSEKENFLLEFTEEDFTYLNDGWNAKILRAQNKDQTWVLCYGEKAK